MDPDAAYTSRVSIGDVRPLPPESGRRDAALRSAAIDGVFVHQPAVHVDHRGALVEMFTTPEFWERDYAYAYQTSIRPNMLKGWFAHQHKIDRYHLVCGELLMLLYDGRAGSRTLGDVQKIVLSERAARQVLIPTGVWHLSLNIASDEAIIVNLPTERYQPEHPDRFHIDINSGDIPVDVHSYFPVAFSGAEDIASTLC